MFKIFKSILESMKQGILGDPEIQRWAQKHPRFSRFLKNRFTPDERFGLHLTLGVFIALFFIFIFFKLFQGYMSAAALVEADIRILNLVELFRGPRLANVMIAITSLGNWQVVFLGTALFTALFTLAKKWRYVFALLFSVLGGEVVVWIIKHLVERPRPSVIEAISSETSYSFPSGHAFVALSFYGLIAYFLFRKVKSRSARFFVALVGIVIILSIGISRIYLGAHWPSDVFASFAAGSAWLAAIVTALEIRRKFNHGKERKPFLNQKLMTIYSVAALIFWLIFYAAFVEARLLSFLPKTTSAKMIGMSCAELPEKAFISLPKMSETLTGKTMEPINIILAGEAETISSAFYKANWVTMDNPNLASALRFFKTSLFKQSYPEAPGAPSFWNAEPNSWGFEQPTSANVVSERHHLHLWKTPIVCDGKPVWFGTAHFDTEIKKGGLLFTHTIDPAVDREREKIKSDLKKTGLVKDTRDFQIVEPMMGSNFAGDYFFTDGKATIVEL